jgi:hypothetical protein
MYVFTSRYFLFIYSSVKENALNWEDYLRLKNGEPLSIVMDNTFTHDFKGLSISINQRHMNLKITNNKQCVNNQYIPINIKK